MGIIALGSIVYFCRVYICSSHEEREDLLQIALYILLFTFFCSLFEQAGSSLMLFFDKSVDRQILGIEFPSSALLSLGPIFVLICSPLLVFVSEKFIEKNKSISGLVKMGVGFLLTALSFFILAFGCSNAAQALVSPYWVGGSILIQTIGELLIVPIGFSNISRLAPPRFKSLMMSFWLMAIAYGHYFGGYIAKYSLVENTGPWITTEHFS